MLFGPQSGPAGFVAQSPLSTQATQLPTPPSPGSLHAPVGATQSVLFWQPDVHVPMLPMPVVTQVCPVGQVLLVSVRQPGTHDGG